MSIEEDRETPVDDDRDPPVDDDQNRPVDPRPARRRLIWRRLRRSMYAFVLITVGVPVIAFIVCYELWDVPNPDQIAAEQDQTITLYYSDGETELARIAPRGGERTLVTFSHLPVHVQNAVLAAEDNSFWSNEGFDVTGILRATWNNVTGSNGGGSTITQQYIKKATGKEDHSLFRKFRELVLAKKMSDTYEKKDILTAYLNTVYFGRGANGIQAAARAYFGKDVQALNVSEAALLAGVIQRPTYWDPDIDRENAERRWRFVIDQMSAQGWLSAQDRDNARFPATLPREPDDSRSGPLAHIQTQVLAELEERADISRDEAHQRGYRIVTTIDRQTQEQAESSTREVLAGQPDYLRSALTSVDPHTGGVVAYYGGDDPTGLDYAQSMQEPGTAFSPFVLVAALEQGLSPGTRLNGSSPRTVGGISLQNPPGVTCDPCTIDSAVRNSADTALAELAERVGTDKVAEAAYQAGIPRTVRDRPTIAVTNGAPDPRIAIGTGQTTVRTIDMAAAFATLAANGTRTSPHFVERVKTPAHEIVYQFTGTAQPAFNTDIARNVTDTLLSKSLTMVNDRKQGRLTAMQPGVRAYSTDGETAKAWTVGYSSDLATAVWFGADRLQALKGRYHEPAGREHDITGEDEPATVWRAVMAAYQGGTDDPGPFPIPRMAKSTPAAPPAPSTAPPVAIPPERTTATAPPR